VGTQQDVQDQADRIGKAGLPVLGLLHLGWFFERAIGRRRPRAGGWRARARAAP